MMCRAAGSSASLATYKRSARWLSAGCAPAALAGDARAVLCNVSTRVFASWVLHARGLCARSAYAQPALGLVAQRRSRVVRRVSESAVRPNLQRPPTDALHSTT